MNLLNQMFVDFKDNISDPSVLCKLESFFECANELQVSYNDRHGSEETLIAQCEELTASWQTVRTVERKLRDEDSNLSIKLASMAMIIDGGKLKEKEYNDAIAEKVLELKHDRKENEMQSVNLESITHALDQERRCVIRDLEQNIDKLAISKSEMNALLNECRMQNGILFDEYQEIHQFKSVITNETLNISGDISRMSSTIEEHKIEYQSMEGKIKNVKKENEHILKEVAIKCEIECNLESQLNSGSKQVSEAQKLVGEHSIKLDSCEQRNEVLFEEYDIINNDIQNIRNMNEEQKHEIANYAKLLHIKRNVEKRRLLKKVNLLNCRIRKMEIETREILMKKNISYDKCNEIREEISHLESMLNLNERHFDAYKKEKDLIINYGTAVNANIEQLEINISTTQSCVKNYNNENSSQRKLNKELKKMMNRISMDIFQLQKELQSRKSKLNKMSEYLIEKTEDEKRIRTRIERNEDDLKQQQSLICKVRLDRNIYNKSLIDEKVEIQSLLQLFNSINLQISEVKMELSEKDQFYICSHFNVDQCDKDVLIIRGKIECILKKIGNEDIFIHQLHHSLQTLNDMMVSADRILNDNQKQLHHCIHEQQMLANKLIEKRVITDKCFEDIKLLKSLFNKGNDAFISKLKSNADLTSISYDLNTKLLILHQNVDKIESIESFVRAMENELLSENIKIESLRCELMRPVNVHRWRQLKDTNPKVFQLISKCQHLNANLLSQTAMVHSRMCDINDKERLYINLRHILAIQPGNESREQLQTFINVLYEKKSKLKLIQSQLRMYQNKCQIVKYEICLLKKDKQMLKLDYFQICKLV